MTIEQRDKYAYELMVKNNQEEAVKQLLLKDKIIEETQQRINEALEFYEKYGANLLSNGCIKKSIKTILKGEE